MNKWMFSKSVGACLLAVLATGCASNPPVPAIEMKGVVSAPESKFNFGYSVEGLNHGLTNVQAFDNSSSTFFILPPGVSADRAYTMGEISKGFRSDGVYSVVDAVADSWVFTASNGEAYCVTKADDPRTVCAALIRPVINHESSSKQPVATPLPKNAQVFSKPVMNAKKTEHRSIGVAEDKVIERESTAQIRARLEKLKIQLQSIIEQLKKEDKNA